MKTLKIILMMWLVIGLWRGIDVNNKTHFYTTEVYESVDDALKDLPRDRSVFVDYTLQELEFMGLYQLDNKVNIKLVPQQECTTVEKYEVVE